MTTKSNNRRSNYTTTKSTRALRDARPYASSPERADALVAERRREDIERELDERVGDAQDRRVRDRYPVPERFCELNFDC